MVKSTSSNTQGSSIGPLSLDMLGTKFSLGFPTLTGKFQTKLGGYVTLLMALLFGAAFIVIFSQFFETDTPMVTSSLEFGSKIVKENLFEQEIFLPIALFTQVGGLMGQRVEKFFTAKIKLIIFEKDPKTGRSGLKINRMVDYVRCSEIKDLEILEKFIRILPDKSFLPGAICPDFRGIKQEFFVKTDPINFSFNEILLLIYPCSLPDSSECASKQEVNDAILIFYRLDKFVVSTDKENPLRENFDRNNVRFDTFNTKYQYMDVKKNMVIDDTSIYGNPHIKLDYATATLATTDSRSRDPTNLHCTKEQIETGIYNTCAEYLLIAYRAVSYMVVVRRTYKKLTTIMGEFGGVLKLVTTAVMVFYSIYSSWKMRTFFMKHLFNLNEKNSKDFKELINQADMRKKRKRMREASSRNILAKQIDPTSGNAEETQTEPLPFRGMKDIMKICVAHKLTATDILSKLQFVEVLEKTLFTEEERTLLPLVMLRMKEEELEKSPKNQQRQRQGPEKIFKQNQGKSPKEKKFLERKESDEKGTQNVYKQAYLKMISKEESMIPEDEHEEDQQDFVLRASSKTLKIVRKFIIKNLEGFFLGEGRSSKDPILEGQAPHQPMRRLSKREDIRRRYILEHDEQESSSRYLKFVMKKNKVAPEQKKKSLFSSDSAHPFKDQRTEFTPLKVQRARRDWEGSSKRLVIGTPLRKKVTLKKSKLFFKMEDSDLQKKEKKSRESLLSKEQDKGEQTEKNLGSLEKRSPGMELKSTPRPSQEFRGDQE